MKYVRQFVIIMFLSFLGEILKAVIPLPIPSSIYGLVLMLLVLKMGIVKLEDVKDAGNLFIDIMPLMFIPAAVGLLDAWSDISGDSASDSVKYLWAGADASGTEDGNCEA